MSKDSDWSQGWDDDEPAFAWVGRMQGYEAVHSALAGTVWTRDHVPDGWRRAASPAEAVVGADFTFLAGEDAPGEPDAFEALLARGILTNAPPGATVIVCGADPDHARRLAARLDAAGLDALDMALLPEPVRLAFGGMRDTFNLLKPHLAPRSFFCGACGAGGWAMVGERTLLARGSDERVAALAQVFAAAERDGAFPQALRNAWLAGPLASPAFEEEARRLTRR